MAKVFRKARAAAPSVVFFDEIGLCTCKMFMTKYLTCVATLADSDTDALATQRGASEGAGVGDRVLSQVRAYSGVF